MVRFTWRRTGAVLLTLFTTGVACAEPTEAELLAQFRRIDAAMPVTTRRLTLVQRQQILQTAVNHPVAGLAHIGRYDPTGAIGFCFGRAMLGYLLARQMGLHPQSTAKLFIIGDLRQAGAANAEWYFHVTPMERRKEDGKWDATDPITGETMPAERWIRFVKSTWDLNDRARLYLMPGNVVFPNIHMSPTGRTGNHIMEVGFKPWEKAGFRKQKIGPYDVYLMDDVRRNEHFIGTETEHPFEFQGITIGGTRYDYNSYFVRLLEGFERPAVAALALAAAPMVEACPAVAAAAPALQRNRLGSPQFWRPR